MLDVIIGRHTWNCQIRTHIQTGYTHIRTNTQKKRVERLEKKRKKSRENQKKRWGIRKERNQFIRVQPSINALGQKRCERQNKEDLTTGSRLLPRSSLVCFCAALNVFKSRAHLRNSTGSVGVGPTNALLPAPALPEIIVRPSDARPAIVASCFTGVLLCCALCLHISCTRAEPYGVRSKNSRCSRAPRQLQLQALDLLSSPC